MVNHCIILYGAFGILKIISSHLRVKRKIHRDMRFTKVTLLYTHRKKIVAGMRRLILGEGALTDPDNSGFDVKNAKILSKCMVSSRYWKGTTSSCEWSY